MVLILKAEENDIFIKIQSDILKTSFKDIGELEEYLDESIALVKSGEKDKVDLCEISRFYKKYNTAIKECENYWVYSVRDF